MKRQEAPGEDGSLPLRPSSVRKIQAILDAAEEIFLRTGYADASMDEVSEQACVSKQTVYTHFGDKKRLFLAVVERITSDAAARVHYEVADPADRNELAAYLEDYARRQLDVVLDERVLAVRRLVIAEALRFPQLAETFWHQGPSRAIDEMQARFCRFDQIGLISTPNPAASASAFNWMVMGQALNAAMLLGARGVPSPTEREQIASNAARIFLAAHSSARGNPTQWQVIDHSEPVAKP